jgi:mycoredoxin
MSEQHTASDPATQVAQSKTPLKVYGTTWCGDCTMAKRLLDKLTVPYEWIDISGDTEAIAYVESINGGYRSVPTILFPDGHTLTEPSGRELTAALMAKGYVAA